MATATFAGKTVKTSDDGYLTDPSEWNRDVAAAIAAEEGISSLSEGHWKVIGYLQAQFKATGTMPTIRGLKNSGIIPVKELYDLFPGGPLKKASRIAGLKKPESCI